MQSKKVVGRNWSIRGEYVILALIILFGFLASTVTIYGLGTYGGVELNPYNNIWFSNNLGYLGFIINSLFIIAFVKFGIMRYTPKGYEQYRFLLLGLLLGVAFTSFLFDFLNLMYLNT